MINEQNTQAGFTSPVLANSGVVTVDGIKYAVGLMWQPVQNLDDPHAEIRETMESEPDADLYCLRQSVVTQYGVGRSLIGHKDGMPSLASSVASALSQYESFCAVFRVEEGWWFVAVRNNLILAEEDILFATEDEAQRAYSSMMAVPDWDLCIVPQDWNIDGTTQMPLGELASKGRKVRLQAVNSSHKTYFLVFIAAVIVIVLAFLIYMLIGLWNEVFKTETIDVSGPTPQVIEVQQPMPEKPKPWEKIVSLTPFVNKCWDNIYQIKSISFPGWRMGLITCNAEGITTTWAKNGREGLLSWIKFGIQEYEFTDLIVDVNAAAATGTVKFFGLPIVASQPELDMEQLRENLTEIQQSTGLNLNFQAQTILDPPNFPDGTRPTNQKSYSYFALSTLSDYTPWEWIKFFDKFKGFELTKIEYNPSNDTTTKWKYEGRIYAK